jgi:imidazolonepropionase|tara:strand:+ start:925 stop:2244 length:1320 start_codon:yes stop_codon:yes gene_type:complete
MRHLVIGIGELAHLDDGTTGLIYGNQMNDEEKLISKNLGIFIENGVISKIRPDEELIDEYAPSIKKNLQKSFELINLSDILVTNAGGNAVIPGLIDGHTHLIWSGDRSNEISLRMKGMSYREISELGGGIKHTVNETRNSNDELLTKLGEIRLKEALRNGTTAIEAKSGYGLSTESELRLTSIMNDLSMNQKNPSIDITWMGAHDTPPKIAGKEISKREYIEEIINIQLPEIVEQGYARNCDVFCEPGWFNIEETERIIDASSKEGLSTRLHIDEFSDGQGAELAAKKSVETADHALYSSEEGREKMSKANVIQGFLPGAPYTMGLDKWPPINYCIENNQPWTISTDFNPNCRILSLPSIASICVQRLGINPLATLCAASRNAGESVVHRTEKQHGMIKEGYVANINILNGEKWQGWCLQQGTSPFKATILEGNPVVHT